MVGSSRREIVSKILQTTKNRITKQNVGNDKNTISKKNLNLMMLTCEEKAPYGPPLNTARMFLNLFSGAQQHILDYSKNPENVSSGTETLDDSVSVSITVYNCVQFDYPTSKNEWDSYDGIIIPGSFSAAYDETPWIQKLKEVIKKEIHSNSRPTLGVCFGHQIYAHALEEWNDSKSTSDGSWGGKAKQCPKGTQAGRRPFTVTPEGLNLLFQHFHYPTSSHDTNDEPVDENTKQEVHLLYTHGDMVAQLPSCAVALGGNSNVPIQSAAYFSSSQDARLFQARIQDQYSNQDTPDESTAMPFPHVFTFQAHPEYVTTSDFVNMGCSECTKNESVESNVNSTSLNPTTNGETLPDSFSALLTIMGDEGLIPKESVALEKEDSKLNQDLIRNDSVYAIMNVARNLGWM